MARLLACLRIAASVAVRFARLAFGWWGFTLPTRSRTGWVAYSWFLSLSHALILHVPFCLVALPHALQVQHETVPLRADARAAKISIRVCAFASTS